MGCVSYMASGLDLVDENIDYYDRVKSVALGLHGVHKYATTRWIHHIEELSKHLSHSSTSPDGQLIKHIRSLCKRHDELLRLRKMGKNVPEVHVPNEMQLVAFQDVQEFCHLAGQIQEHKRQFGSLLPEHSQGMTNSRVRHSKQGYIHATPLFWLTKTTYRRRPDSLH